MKQAGPSLAGEKAAQNEQSSGSGNKRRTSFFNPVVQPKLHVNRPNDTFEQEADHMADQVMHQPAANTFFTPAPASVQRDDKNPQATDTSSKVLTEGATLTYEQL